MKYKSVKSGLPEPGRPVLAVGKNDLGPVYVIAEWTEHNSWKVQMHIKDFFYCMPKKFITHWTYFELPQDKGAPTV